MSNDKIILSAIKIGLLGDCTVGKTSVCKVFTGLEFSDEEMVTIGSDKFEKKFYLQNGKEIKLHYFMNKVDFNNSNCKPLILCEKTKLF